MNDGAKSLATNSKKSWGFCQGKAEVKKWVVLEAQFGGARQGATKAAEKNGEKKSQSTSPNKRLIFINI